MTATNNITGILQPYLKEIENVYGQAFDLMILIAKSIAMLLAQEGLLLRFQREKARLPSWYLKRCS